MTGDYAIPQPQTNALIENWFTYHAPNEDQQKRYVELRAAAKNMAYARFSATPSPTLTSPPHSACCASA